ncbi:MAG: hypothetical protein U9O95_04720 [Candidatus Marinimicrobia bacterium]|nr:hypothetical protein [Candidatus Neomarinimicrobiota bacterium]
MAKTKKIIALILLSSLLLFADGTDSKGVYFKMETPYLFEISEILKNNNYVLMADSSNAIFRGELYYYLEDNDSIRCEIQLQTGQDPPFVLASFLTEPVDAGNVRNSVAKFSIWMLLLNAVTAILFFARST